MKKEKFKIKFAVYLIPRRGNEVLLSLRKNTGWMDGYYSLIAGHVDGSETPEEATVRETKEEAGATVSAEDLKFVHVMHRLKDNPDDEYIDMFFESEKWDGDFVNAEPEKCGGLDWFAIDNLPTNTLAYIKDVIEMSQQPVYFSSRRSDA
jgi:8-oxo-dGTP diphosphatase